MKTNKFLLCLAFIPLLGLSQNIGNSFPKNFYAGPVISAGPDLLLLPGVDTVYPSVSTDDPGPGQTYTYLWIGPQGWTSTQLRPAMFLVGEYTLQVTNPGGCSSFDEISVSLFDPTDTVWLVNELPGLCENGDSIPLDNYVTYPGDGYFQGVGVVGRMFDPSAVPDSLFSPSGGSVTLYPEWVLSGVVAQTAIQVWATPKVHVNLDTVWRCLGETAYLSGVGYADSYNWSYLTDPSTILSTSQHYLVEVNQVQDYLLTAGFVYSDQSCWITDTTQTRPISADFAVLQDTATGAYGTIFYNTVQCVPYYRGATSYAWEFGDGGSSSLVSPNYEYSHVGNYVITLEMNSMCGIDQQDFALLVNYIGIEEMEKDQELVLYPNPTSDYIRVELLDSFSDYQICDMIGSCVLQGSISSSSLQIDVEHLQTGVYSLVFISKFGQKVSAKFVKK